MDRVRNEEVRTITECSAREIAIKADQRVLR